MAMTANWLEYTILKTVVVCVFVVFLFLWTSSPDITKISSDKSLPSRMRHILEKHTGRDLPLHMSPAIMANEPDFSKSLVAGTRRAYRANIAIGVTCIQRQKGVTYIFSTIDSLLNQSSESQQERFVIVILLADLAPEVRLTLANNLLGRYRRHFESGLLQAIQAPRSFYPDLENLKATYYQPMHQVKWRSKQNYDFAYLMLYCRNLATYYLQLEDDVTTVQNYIGQMEDFISRYKFFVCLEFSELGFIAKLYHSYDLEKLAKMLMLFYNEQPNDVTYLHFNELMLQFRRIVRKPTLFQHHGFYSSLNSKQETLKDIFFVGEDGSPQKMNDSLPVVRRIERGIRGPEEVNYAERQRIIKEKETKVKNSANNVPRKKPNLKLKKQV